jgi:DNA-directed RNA polymerase I subunit RPA43
MAPIQSSDSSLFHLEQISQYVSLPPSALNAPLPAICACIFSPLLLSYYPPARGIVLAYQNVQLSDAPRTTSTTTTSPKSKRRRESQPQLQPRPNTHWESGSEDEDDEEDEGEELLLRVVDEYSAPFLWATADLLVWRPAKNVWIEGRIVHQSSTHITLSHLNTFPISILKTNMPEGWEWHGNASTGEYKKGNRSDEGYWADADGMPVEDQLRVRIRDWDGRMDGKGTGKGFLRIVGSLVSEETEKALEIRRKEKRAKKSLQRRQEVTELDGEAMEVE